MVWLAGAGEFPMSVSLPRNGRSSIGVKAMGAGSKLLYECKAGAKLGVRGPYGKPFDLNRSKKSRRIVLLAGGGTGLVPILVLSRAFEGLKNTRAIVVVSARTKSEVPFLKNFAKYHAREDVYVTTDDGSLGHKSLGHEKVRELVESHPVDEIFSCGPELMMAQIYNIAKRNHIPVQFSLERIMKCGMGICGSCTIGDRVLCKDGPVLNERELHDLSNEFGHYTRAKTGTLLPY
jgi:dihydroorotate dehydrogenase electron transfer subunit